MIDPNDLLKKVKGVLVIDLLEHALGLDAVLADALLAPPLGLYMKGSSQPLLVEGKNYYPRSGYMNPKAKIRDFNTISTLNEDVLDEQGSLALSFNTIRRSQRFLTLVPDTPIVAIEAAKVIVLDYLSTLCRHARVVNNVYLENLVKPEYRHLMQGAEFEDAFSSLLNLVHEFVGDDSWFIYFSKCKGSLLVIEKIVDYRIYHYHKQEHDNWLQQAHDEYERRLLNDTEVYSY